MNIYADRYTLQIHIYHDVVVSSAHHFLRASGPAFPSRVELDVE